MFKIWVLTAVIGCATWWFLNSGGDTNADVEAQTSDALANMGMTEPAADASSATTQVETKLPPQATMSKAEYAKQRLAAAPPPRERVLAQSNEALQEEFKKLPRSAAVSLGGRSHFVIGARAIPDGLFHATDGVPLVKQNGFTIVAQDLRADKDWAQIVIRAGDRPVLVNPDNGRAEIVTGTIILELKDMSTAQAVAQNQGLKLTSVNASISRAYYTAPENYHLVPGMAQLNRDPAVKSVEVEIIQGKVYAR